MRGTLRKSFHGGEGMMNGNIGCKSEMFSQVDFEKEEALSVSGKDGSWYGFVVTL